MIHGAKIIFHQELLMMLFKHSYTYYYAISAGNGRGKSWISNCQSVTVAIDKTPPGEFSIYSPSGWASDQNPTIIGQFYEGLSGVDVSTVNYSYSLTGNLTPTNWNLATEVFTDQGCNTHASDGNNGWIYVQIHQFHSIKILMC